MNIRQLNEAFRKFYEYTEEPDAFETQSEKDMNNELEDEIDNDLKQKEKQDRKCTDIVKAILDNNNLEYHYIEKQKAFKVYFNGKYEYNKFMAREKNSKRLDSCLRQLYDKDKPFEKLSKDAGQRFLVLFVK